MVMDGQNRMRLEGGRYERCMISNNDQRDGDGKRTNERTNERDLDVGGIKT